LQIFSENVPYVLLLVRVYIWTYLDGYLCHEAAGLYSLYMISQSEATGNSNQKQFKELHLSRPDDALKQ